MRDQEPTSDITVTNDLMEQLDQIALSEGKLDPASLRSLIPDEKLFISFLGQSRLNEDTDALSILADLSQADSYLLSHTSATLHEYSPLRDITASKIANETAQKDRSIDQALTQIEKQFGKGSIMRLGSKEAIIPIAVISTGSISFDAALGVGGFPRGRLVEIFGPESSGKTTVALQVIAEAQKTGGMAAFVDAEHALDPIYARKLGVDVDNLLVAQPDYGEQALEIAEALVRSNAIDVLVVDSVAALVPKAELEGEMGDSHMGLQARLMSQALRKLTGIVSKSRTCLIFINQIREKIGVMFGNPETTTGGRALKFYSSVRVDIRRIGAIKDGDVVVGNRTKIKVVKNKTAAPFREAEFDIMYGEGISREGDLLDMGVAKGIVEKFGAWFSYKGERIGHGREIAKGFLRTNPKIASHLQEDIRQSLGLRTNLYSPQKDHDSARITATKKDFKQYESALSNKSRDPERGS